MSDRSPQGDQRTNVIIWKQQSARVKRLYPDASVSAVTRRALDRFLDQAEAAEKQAGSTRP